MTTYSEKQDHPKTLRDMTDAEIGALVRAHGEGKAVEYFSGLCSAWRETPLPDWTLKTAYRIAPPKFLPLEAGKVYRTRDGWDRTCIAVRGDTAWLILSETSAAYRHDATTGKSTLGKDNDIIGLSENQELGQ